MPESVAICQPFDKDVEDSDLQAYIQRLLGPGGAHRAWIDDENSAKFVCRTYWIEDQPIAADAPSLSEPVGLAEAPTSNLLAAADASSRDLADLVVEFREKVETVLAACAERNIHMRPFFTLRGPVVQARLWRQSRSSAEVQAKIAELDAASAPFLAECIRAAGPQSGRWVTNAIPGLSWHQWSEAIDCFWLVDGEAEWSTRKKVDGQNGYKVFAEEAERAGLTAGGHWRSFKDWPHVQLRSESNPGRSMSLEEVDREMRQRFAI